MWVGWAMGTAGLLFVLLALFAVGRVVQMLAHSVQTATASHRNPLSRVEAEKRLEAAEAIESAEPAQAVESLSKLLPELEHEPALADLADKARPQIARARQRLAEADLAAARQAIASNPSQAITLAEHVMATTANLPPGAGRELQEGAQSLASQVAEQSGILLVPPHGRFRLGSHSSYDAELRPLLTDLAQRHGYVPLGANSPFHALWDQRARYRLAIDVNEDQGDYYLQSKNRISMIEADIALTRSGTDIWHGRCSARTQVPLPNLRVYEAHRLALGEKRVPEVEQRFYKDAFLSLRAKLIAKLREFPDVSN